MPPPRTSPSSPERPTPDVPLAPQEKPAEKQPKHPREETRKNLKKLEETRVLEKDDELLGAMRKEIGVPPAVVERPESAKTKQEPPTQKQEPTFLDKAKNEITNVKEDFVNGSGWTKAGYIAGGVVGFLAARWLWHKAFGEGENEGFVKKSVKWILSLGAAGLAILGVKAAKDYLTDPRNALPGAAGDALVSGKKGAEKGVDEVGKNYRKAHGIVDRKDFETDEAYARALKEKNEKAGMGSLNREDYPDDKQYIDALKRQGEKIQAEGGSVAWVENTLYFIGLNGVASVCKLPSELMAMFNVAINSDKKEKWMELEEVHINGMILYATSFATLDFALLTAMLGPRAAVKKAALNTIAWPFSIMKKGRIILGVALPGAQRTFLLTQLEAAREGSRYMQYRAIDLLKTFSDYSEGTIERLVTENKTWARLSEELHRAGYDTHDIGKRINYLQRKLKDALGSYYKKEGKIPAFIEAESNLAKAIQTDSLKNFNLSDEVMNEIHIEAKTNDSWLKKFLKDESSGLNRKTRGAAAEAPTDAAKAGATGAETVVEAADDAAEAEKLAKAAGAESLTGVPEKPELKVHNPDIDDVAKGTAEAAETADDAVKAGKSVADAAEIVANTPIDELLKDKRIVKALSKAAESADAEKAIRASLNGLDEATIKLIGESGKAKKLLAGAIKSGQPAEIERIVQAANKAKTWRLGRAAAWNGAGVLGDAFGVYMAYCDWEANKERITQTDNEELKALYADANLIYLSDGTANAAGLLIGGIAIYQSWAAGNGIVVALGAPAGAIMLPITVAVMAQRYTHGKIEESAEYHTLREKDLQKKFSPGQILEHIGKSTALENVNWAQDFFVNAEAATKANEMARINGYRAYFAQIAVATIPQVTALDLDDDLMEKKMSKQQLETHLINEQRNRIARFVRDAEEYIAYKTFNGTTSTYENVNAQTLHDASLYAEGQFEKREQGEETEHARPNDRTYWAKVTGEVVQRSEDSKKIVTEKVAESSKDYREFESQVQNSLLYLIRDDLAVCESKVLTTNYDNLTSMSSDDYMRSVARGMYAEDILTLLSDAAESVRDQKKTMTPEQVQDLVRKLKNILLQEPNALANKARKDKSADYYRNIGASSQRLSVPGILDHINSYRLTAPGALGRDARDALPLTSLEYHRGDQNVVTLDLPQGEKIGYLSVTENYAVRKAKPGAQQSFIGPGKTGAGYFKPEAGEYQFWKEEDAKNERPDFVLIVRPSSLEAKAA